MSAYWQDRRWLACVTAPNFATGLVGSIRSMAWAMLDRLTIAESGHPHVVHGPRPKFACPRGQFEMCSVDIAPATCPRRPLGVRLHRRVRTLVVVVDLGEVAQVKELPTDRASHEMIVLNKGHRVPELAGYAS